MELALLGVNVLLLFAVWRFMLRKSILDDTRDQLFDLRDEVRATFIKNGWDLNSHLYKNLRDLLNGHLRFTEQFSIWKIAFLEAEVRKQQELSDEIHSRVAKLFVTQDSAQNEFVRNVRRRALVAVMDFAVFGSGLLLTISLVMAPFVAVARLFQVLRGGLGSVLALLRRSFSNGGHAISKMMSSSSASLSKVLFVPDVFESYSYRIGTA